MKPRTRPTPFSYDPAAGLELEMVVAHAATGQSLPVEKYLPALQRLLAQEHALSASPPPQPHLLAGRCVAVSTSDAEYGLDNGFNLLETSTRPVRRSEGGLQTLARLAQTGLNHVFTALQADDACVLNASQHPDCPRDAAWYQEVRVPRPIYRELVEYRGWHHWEGIDAKAQNGANVQVPVADAIRALNVMIGLSAAHVALFANSPLESGHETGLKETRLTVWPRVFGHGRFGGDALLAGFPPRPFVDLGDYFRWMFRPGTVSRSLPMSRRHDYKAAPTVLLEGDPSLSAFLVSPGWPGRRTDTGEAVHLVPDTVHFEHSQIAQFMDARLRYRLASLPALPDLLAAWQQRGGLERLFETYGAEVYIEGRSPGAGFPDVALLEEGGQAVAASLLMCPVAMQWGLQQQLEAAEQLIADCGWRRLGQLRDRAMQVALEDAEVRSFAQAVLKLAEQGLDQKAQPLLDYARYALETGRTGADRMLETWRACGSAPSTERLAAVVARHRAVLLRGRRHVTDGALQQTGTSQ